MKVKLTENLQKLFQSAEQGCQELEKSVIFPSHILL
jgi:hypothetical protein